MAWKLEGSYAETCSCELMCPCNLSFDHGATYDFCRATLAFHVREGEIEGTDVDGLNAVVIIDTPKVMTDGNWRLGDVHRRAGRRRAGGQAGQGVQRAARWADGGNRAASRRGAGRRARGDRADRRGPPAQRARRRRDRLRGRGHRPLGVETGQPVRFDGMFDPAGSNLTMAEAKRSQISAFGIEYEGKTGLSTSKFAWAA